MKANEYLNQQDAEELAAIERLRVISARNEARSNRIAEDNAHASLRDARASARRELQAERPTR